MATNSYLITYDLIKRKNYPELLNVLEEFDYWHCLGSVWIVKSELDSKGIRDLLQQHIDSDDQLIVVKLTGQAAWTKSFPDNCKQWLKDNL